MRLCTVSSTGLGEEEAQLDVSYLKLLSQHLDHSEGLYLLRQQAGQLLMDVLTLIFLQHIALCRFQEAP